MYLVSDTAAPYVITTIIWKNFRILHSIEYINCLDLGKLPKYYWIIGGLLKIVTKVLKNAYIIDLGKYF